MDYMKITLVSLTILPLGLGSIHIAEVLRWFEPRRGLWKIALASGAAFACACGGVATLVKVPVGLLFHRGVSFIAVTYLETVVQMLFATYFLVALVYLLHCVVWVVTRFGRRVFMDELFSRLVVLAVFTVIDLGAYLILFFVFGT